MADNELLYHIALGKIHGVGSKIAKHLINYCGTASNVFNASPGKLKSIPGVGQVLVDSINQFNDFESIEEEISQSSEAGVDILFYTHPEYPNRLKQIYDSPLVLYTKGNKCFNHQRSIAIVGTRSATSYGKHFTEEIVKQLAPYAPTIISGLAFGIDIAAHKAALDNELSTISVMANGINRIYPAEHKGIASDIEHKGALVTEYPLNCKPEMHYFPARNRIIAGLADAVIVIEAAKKGGALITAELANAYNREVFALPGDYDRMYSEGCNRLIKQHKANILTSVEDIVYYLNWDLEGTTSTSLPPSDLYVAYDLDGNEKKLLELLSEHYDGIHIDELCWQSSININKLAGVLLNLEFKGLIKSLPGKKFQINTKSIRL